MNKLAELGKKALISVGRNNKPTYTVIAVATANGIFKPISSLTDKKEKPEARKYAALREFATEVVAVPTYWLCGVGAAKIGEKMFSKDPVKGNITKANMMFLGVCTAALFVIPAVCSIALAGLDKIIKKDHKTTGSQNTLDVVSKGPQTDIYPVVGARTEFGNLIQKPSITTFANRGGLKI